jgi:general secretion pathway protein H
MPILATGKRDSGFTLVELMVVIAIIALMTSAVVLSFPDNDGRVRAQAERFAARVALARDTAITKVRPVAVIVDQSGYRFEECESGDWLPLELAEPWGAGVTMQANAKRIGFDPVGLAEQDSVITLVKGDERSQILISAGGDVRVAP